MYVAVYWRGLEGVGGNWMVMVGSGEDAVMASYFLWKSTLYATPDEIMVVGFMI